MLKLSDRPKLEQGTHIADPENLANAELFSRFSANTQCKAANGVNAT